MMDLNLRQVTAWSAPIRSGFLLGLCLVSLAVGVTVQAETVPEGLQASLPAVLSGSKDQFRQHDFEVYRWAADTDIVILDFRSLKIQDDYVKRMVFFLEKAGFRGRLLSDAQLKGRHGWNANDFSPESLVLFYTTAREQKFTLNPNEEYFLQCLLAWGILVQTDSGLMPGKGALVSIAQNMNPGTRRLLLQHETTHAVYFTSGEFRSFVAEQWQALPAEPKAFLIRYFRFMRYDTADSKLMANEFQAYLLQQPLESLNDFLTRKIVKDFQAVYPDDRDFAKRAKANAPVLQDAAANLAAWLDEQLGISMSDLTR